MEVEGSIATVGCQVHSSTMVGGSLSANLTFSILEH